MIPFSRPQAHHHDVLTQLVEEHMVELYHITAVETYHKAFLKLEASTQQICSCIHTGPSHSEVPTVNVIGLVAGSMTVHVG